MYGRFDNSFDMQNCSFMFLVITKLKSGMAIALAALLLPPALKVFGFVVTQLKTMAT